MPVQGRPAVWGALGSGGRDQGPRGNAWRSLHALHNDQPFSLGGCAWLDYTAVAGCFVYVCDVQISSRVQASRSPTETGVVLR